MKSWGSVQRCAVHVWKYLEHPGTLKVQIWSATLQKCKLGWLPAVFTEFVCFWTPALFACSGFLCFLVTNTGNHPMHEHAQIQFWQVQVAHVQNCPPHILKDRDGETSNIAITAVYLWLSLSMVGVLPVGHNPHQPSLAIFRLQSDNMKCIPCMPERVWKTVLCHLCYATYARPHQLSRHSDLCKFVKSLVWWGLDSLTDFAQLPP